MAFGLAALMMIAVSAVSPLKAQTSDKDKPRVYTYIAEFATPRPLWADMEKVDEQDRPLMDKLVADGTIRGYGGYANLIHQEGEPTHGTWFTATSEGKLMKALEAVYANPGSTTAPAEAASKHWDYIMTSEVYNQRSGKSTGGYLLAERWDVKPGQMREFMAFEKTNAVPLLEKLMADGSITSYGMSTEDFHTEKLGLVTLFFTTPDAGCIDKADAAFDELFAKNPALSTAFQSMAEREGHRDFMYRLRYMSNK